MKHIFNFLFCSIFCLLQHTVFSQGIWTQKASLPDTPRIDAMSFSYWDKGYIVQGADKNMNRLHSVWEYDRTTNSWNQKQNFIGVARWQGVSFGIGSKGYIATGQDQSSFSNNDLWEYDFSNDTWSQKANLPGDPRNFGVGFAIGTKAYVGLGNGGNAGYLNDLWEYDANANSWLQKADFPDTNGRIGAVGLAIGTKGYVGIGMDQYGNRYDDFWEYDPANDTWTQKTNFPGGAREEIDGAHFSFANCGYMGMGRSVVNSSWVYYNDFWRYDPALDTWTSLPAIPIAGRIGASAFSINTFGFIGMGYDITGATWDDLWSFTDTTLVDGIPTSEITPAISVFPNPFNTTATLTSSIPLKDASLSVINLQGEVIYEKHHLKGERIVVDGKGISEGIYFIQLKAKEKVLSTRKVMIID